MARIGSKASRVDKTGSLEWSWWLDCATAVRSAPAEEEREQRTEAEGRRAAGPLSRVTVLRPRGVLHSRFSGSPRAACPSPVSRPKVVALLKVTVLVSGRHILREEEREHQRATRALPSFRSFLPSPHFPPFARSCLPLPTIFQATMLHSPPTPSAPRLASHWCLKSGRPAAH